MTTVGTREDAVTTREDASTSRSTVKDASWMRDDVGGANEGLFERCRGARRGVAPGEVLGAVGASGGDDVGAARGGERVRDV